MKAGDTQNFRLRRDGDWTSKNCVENRPVSSGPKVWQEPAKAAAAAAAGDGRTDVRRPRALHQQHHHRVRRAYTAM